MSGVLFILSVLWQLPQDIVGILVVLYTGAWNTREGFWASMTSCFGISLGHFVIFGIRNRNFPCKTDLAHERGHQEQSKLLGWLYLFIIGLPSLSGNIWDRLMHKNWTYTKREQWYYGLPWEAWADKLGGVER